MLGGIPRGFMKLTPPIVMVDGKDSELMSGTRSAISTQTVVHGSPNGAAV